jgi:uncharacterized damage-inducible protein DinB
MNELERALIADSAAAPPSHILEGLSDELVHGEFTGAPHTIFGELWHLAFWQQMTLDWVRGIETPVPEHASAGFPSESDRQGEPWDRLRRRFLAGAEEAAVFTRDARELERSIRCPSLPGVPVRTMTVREQLESLAAHNAYHLGRIVLLRQMGGAWPPASGGFSW